MSVGWRLVPWLLLVSISRLPRPASGQGACGVLTNGTKDAGLVISPLVEISYDDVAGTATFGCTGEDYVDVAYAYLGDDFNCAQEPPDGEPNEGVLTATCRLYCEPASGHWKSNLDFDVFVEGNVLYCETISVPTAIPSTTTVTPEPTTTASELTSTTVEPTTTVTLPSTTPIHVVEPGLCGRIINGTGQPLEGFVVSPFVVIQYFSDESATFACTGIDDVSVAFFFDGPDGPSDTTCDDVTRLEPNGNIVVTCFFECDVVNQFWTKKTEPLNDFRIVDATVYCEAVNLPTESPTTTRMPITRPPTRSTPKYTLPPATTTTSRQKPETTTTTFLSSTSTLPVKDISSFSTTMIVLLVLLIILVAVFLVFVACSSWSFVRNESERVDNLPT